jgi:hypothetical protein
MYLSLRKLTSGAAEHYIKILLRRILITNRRAELPRIMSFWQAAENVCHSSGNTPLPEVLLVILKLQTR